MTKSTKSNAKVAVITGSAGGLGNAIATRLAKDGFRVVLHDISEDNLKKAKAEFDKAGYESITVVGDVSDIAGGTTTGQILLTGGAVTGDVMISDQLQTSGVSTIGDDLRAPKREDIRATVRMMYAASGLMLALQTILVWVAGVLG